MSRLTDAEVARIISYASPDDDDGRLALEVQHLREAATHRDALADTLAAALRSIRPFLSDWHDEASDCDVDYLADMALDEYDKARGLS